MIATTRQLEYALHLAGTIDRQANEQSGLIAALETNRISSNTAHRVIDLMLMIRRGENPQAWDGTRQRLVEDITGGHQEWAG